MEAQTFYTHNKKKSTIENEYFIAMDKESFFEMMDAYALYKIEHMNTKFDAQFINPEYMSDNKIFAK